MKIFFEIIDSELHNNCHDIIVLIKEDLLGNVVK